jgi:hypothetical protein
MGRIRTRFGTVGDGEPRAVFSVDEKPDGSLIIFRTVKNWRHPVTGTDVPFEHQHISIHNSERSLGTTITQKSRMHGHTQSRVAFVHNRAGRLLWPVFGAGIGFHQSGTSPLKPKPRDQVFMIGHPHDFSWSCLLYSVFVADPPLDQRYYPRGANHLSVRFSKYELLVFSSYMMLPTPSLAVARFEGTSSPILDGVNVAEMAPTPARSLTPIRVRNKYNEILDELRLGHVRNFIEEYKKGMTMFPDKAFAPADTVGQKMLDMTRVLTPLPPTEWIPASRSERAA